MTVSDKEMQTENTGNNDTDNENGNGADIMEEDKGSALADSKDEAVINEATTENDEAVINEAATENYEVVINDTTIVKEEASLNIGVTTNVAKVPWKFQTGAGIASSPVIKGDKIYFGSKDGYFYAVNKDTGAEAWRYSAGNPIICQAAVLDNEVFFSSKEVYFAVDAQTGAEIWRYDLKPEGRYTIRKDQWDYHESSPIIDNGVVYFGSGTGAILGFEATSGELVWEFNASGSTAVRSTPLIQDGVIYYGDWSGKYLAVDIKTEEIRWENSYNAGFQNAAVIKDGVIFIGGRDTRIYALDITTGKSKWSFKDPVASWITGDPVIDGDIVYFSTSDSKVVYAMNIKDGTIAAEYPIYMNSFTKVIIDNGRLYVTSGDAYNNPGTGKFQVYKLGDSQNCVWELALDTGGIFTTPLLADGIVYFGCEDGCLYAEEVK